MRHMACPDCGERITWVPLPNGKRVAITTQQDPKSEWYLDANGVLRAGAGKGGEPRYARHAPCPKAED